MARLTPAAESGESGWRRLIEMSFAVWVVILSTDALFPLLRRMGNPAAGGTEGALQQVLWAAAYLFLGTILVLRFKRVLRYLWRGRTITALALLALASVA